MKFKDLNRDRICSNDRKQQDSQPDFEGTLNAKGEESSISAWKRGDGNGSDAQSLFFSVRRQGRNLVEQPRDCIVVPDPLTRPVNHAS